jgi:hypothetical protein
MTCSSGGRAQPTRGVNVQLAHRDLTPTLRWSPADTTRRAGSSWSTSRRLTVTLSTPSGTPSLAARDGTSVQPRRALHVREGEAFPRAVPGSIEPLAPRASRTRRQAAGKARRHGGSSQPPTSRCWSGAGDHLLATASTLSRSATGVLEIAAARRATTICSSAREGGQIAASAPSRAPTVGNVGYAGRWTARRAHRRGQAPRRSPAPKARGLGRSRLRLNRAGPRTRRARHLDAPSSPTAHDSFAELTRGRRDAAPADGGSSVRRPSTNVLRARPGRRGRATCWSMRFAQKLPRQHAARPACS